MVSLLWIVALCAVACDAAKLPAEMAMAAGKYTATLNSEDSVDEAEAGGFGSEITETLKGSTGNEEEFAAGQGDDAEVAGGARAPVPSAITFRDCEEAYRLGSSKSGVYNVQPDMNGPAFAAYCDMTTDKGGWTVIQRRKDGSVDFYRDWTDYVRGFGSVERDFFLGLDKINRLTGNYNSQLRTNLTDWRGATAYAKYSIFGIGNYASTYKLTVSGYSGTAGDSLTTHNGMKFSTYDQDNDASSANCAVLYKGAWWYANCHRSNLNGAYLGTASNGGVVTSYADGVIWYDWKGFYYSLKGSTMMVRRS